MAFTTQPKAAAYSRNLFSHSTPTLNGEEKASSTYKKGAFLIDDDAGLITESTSPISSTAANRTIGLALQDATGVTSAKVPFVYFTGGTVIEITLSDNTAGVHTLVVGDKWAVFPIAKGTNNWALDGVGSSDVAGAAVIGFKLPFTLATTTEARVFAIVTAPARGGADTSSLAW